MENFKETTQAELWDFGQKEMARREMKRANSEVRARDTKKLYPEI
jgi:hypothetical protein